MNDERLDYEGIAADISKKTGRTITAEELKRTLDGMIYKIEHVFKNEASKTWLAETEGMTVEQKHLHLKKLSDEKKVSFVMSAKPLN